MHVVGYVLLIHHSPEHFNIFAIKVDHSHLSLQRVTGRCVEHHLQLIVDHVEWNFSWPQAELANLETQLTSQCAVIDDVNSSEVGPTKLIELL